MGCATNSQTKHRRQLQETNGGVRAMKGVIRIVGRIAYGLLVVYLCLMLAGGLFAFNFVVGLIGLIGLFYRKETDNMLDKSS